MSVSGEAGRAEGDPTLVLGPVGRLGQWTAGHFRAVLLAWIVIVVGLGAFAPRAEHALSGAGWEASGSESVKARSLIDASFGGRSSYALTAVVRFGHAADAR